MVDALPPATSAIRQMLAAAAETAGDEDDGDGSWSERASGTYDMAGSGDFRASGSDYSEYDLAEAEVDPRDAYARVFAQCLLSSNTGRRFQLVPRAWFNAFYDFSGMANFEDGAAQQVGAPAADPGPADCTSLIDGETKELRLDLDPGEYALVHEEIWQLVRQFHPTSGPTSLCPQVRRDGKLELELHPITLRLCTAGDHDFVMHRDILCQLRPDDSRTIPISVDDDHNKLTRFSAGKYWTVKQLMQGLRAFTGTTARRVRVSVLAAFPDLTTAVPVLDTEPEDQRRTLHSIGIVDSAVLLVEDCVDFTRPTAVCFAEAAEDDARAASPTAVELTSFSHAVHPASDDDSDGNSADRGRKRPPSVETWYDSTANKTHFYDTFTNTTRFSTVGTGTHGTSYSNGYSSIDTTPSATGAGFGIARGIAGLNNLGNTCYMNSALQCLLHVPALVRYFLSNQYQDDLNVDNPLGHKGAVADAYADLLKLVWSDRLYSAVRPTAFKATIGRCNEQFAGFGQQDGQELLAFLMDGIHEDLNRVVKKEYTEKVEGTLFESDEAAAAEAWARHLKRHRSVIVDHCQGLYKSTVVCSVCAKRLDVAFCTKDQLIALQLGHL